ncbi:VanZ family protein [Clostridium tagluense]|uniref:VanZ family protein n=1 Tax=Clostridium tagluense TaxID=360422 RepID=UPI001C6E9282|nr:VanZ family protein [Clostridium tagluense]MBW9158662.1 VanZ family protein [Clostridium tagluense]WLC68531.1 VanZ family protein [Clostridium tagluense]
MNKRIISKKFKLFAWVLFILYLPVLIYVIVLKGGSSVGYVLNMARNGAKISFMQKISGINFIPFKTILYYFGGNQSFAVSVQNILGNILAFSPLGFLLPILFNKYKKLKSILFISFAVSLSIEIVQLSLNIGSCDIDDLILNVLGSILGFSVYKLLSHMMEKDLEVTS